MSMRYLLSGFEAGNCVLAYVPTECTKDAEVNLLTVSW